MATRDSSGVGVDGGVVSGDVGAGGGVGGLTGFEVEVIDLFVSAVRLIGIPKSVGEIYGLLYASEVPESLDGLVGRLRMSKGSASQGLKFLRSVGAVRAVYVPGERRDYYEAVVELKQLVGGFIREELLPHLEHGELRLERLREMVEDEGGQGFRKQRVLRLQSWHRRAGQVFPMLKKLLG